MAGIVIGIAGGSCSGKSSLARQIYLALGPDRCAILAQDDYYLGQEDAPRSAGMANFDHPDAIDFALLTEHIAQLHAGQPIDKPLYDFTAHQRQPLTERMAPRPIILVDGTLVLHHRQLRELFDLTIFVDCEDEIRLVRRIDRDIRERGRSRHSVEQQFAEQVAPMHNIYVEPTREFADLIIYSSQSPLRPPLEAIIEQIAMLAP